MFYQPSLLRSGQPGYSAWSNSIVVRNGTLVNATAVQRFHEGPSPMGLAIAESEDGVHWRETMPFTCPLPHGVAGYCIRWTGEDFVYYLTESNAGTDREACPAIMRQYRTQDFRTLSFMGEEYTTRPDERWYRSRWDELVVLREDDGFHGYITSEPHAHLGEASMGYLRSADGLRWEVQPPPVFEWDGLPPQQMEVCFCERIDGRYYLGMGARAYLGHLGYSVMTFVSDTPDGPFRADKEAFRLCGSTSRDVTWLAKTFHFDGEILASNWFTTTIDKSLPGIFGNGQSLWIGPLKRLTVDAGGHLRMAYWRGNDAAKGEPLPLRPDVFTVEHPVPPTLDTQNDGSLTLAAGHDGALVLLDQPIDIDEGFVFEGALEAREQKDYIWTHWHAAAAGFYVEEQPGAGMLMQLETLGLTRTGRFLYAPEPRFDDNPFTLAGWDITQRGGKYEGLSRFEEEDVVGPVGYAAPGGIRHGVQHRFRLFVKGGLMELYLDDLLVQTYVTGPASGRIGLFAKSGTVVFSDLRAWRMG